MRIPSFSALLLATALIAAPSGAALAAPTSAAPAVPAAHVTTADRAAPKPAVQPRATSDAEQYAAREAKDKSAADFQGGSRVVIIGSSTLVLVLVIVLIVILL